MIVKELIEQIYYEIYQLMPKYRDSRTDNWSNLGEDFLQAQKYSEAIVCFDKHLRNNPNDETVLFRKARALNLANRKDEALEAYDQILKMKPTNSIALMEKSEILSEKGDYLAELECLNKFQKSHPKHRESWNRKGLALMKLNRLIEARYCFKRLRLLLPNKPHPINDTALSRIKEIEGIIESRSINRSLTNKDQSVQIQSDKGNRPEGSSLTDDSKGSPLS